MRKTNRGNALKGFEFEFVSIHFPFLWRRLSVIRQASNEDRIKDE
jgi:hypothetical protein